MPRPVPEHPAEPSYARWREAVRAELGVDPARGPRRYVTEDGIVVEPLYARETASAGVGVGLASAALVAAARAESPWMVRQRVEASRVRPADLAEAIDGGADSIELDCGRVAPAALEARLGVLVPLIAGGATEVALRGLPDEALPLAEWAAESLGDRPCSLGVDPLARWACSPTTGDPGRAVALLPSLARLVPRLSPGRQRLLRADGSPWHAAGATSAWTIACVAATGLEYLRALEAAGVDVGVAERRLEFMLPLGTRLLESVATVRALRLVWARVLEDQGASPRRPARVVATFASRELTRREPWNNALRSTVTAVAGAVGGADGILLPPHDGRASAASPAARRLARTTGLIVREEARLTEVADPAAGSWCVDALTGLLAERSWGCLGTIESAGGMVAALRDGVVDGRLAAARRERDAAVRSRRRPILGVSVHPAPDGEAVVPDGGTGEPPSRYVPQADASPFERLRDAADGWASAHGRRPRLVLRRGGASRDVAAAAAVARAVAEAGGLTLDEQEGEAPGFGTVVGLPDDAPLEAVASAIAAARLAGAPCVLVAGAGSHPAVALRAAGADAVIRDGEDVVALLELVHRRSGVLP